MKRLPVRFRLHPLIPGLALLLILTLAPSPAHPSVALSAPAAAPTSPAVYSIGLPLLVDSGGGRLYGRVAVDGVNRQIGVYSSRDGKAVTTFPYSGPFALDAAGQRLFVMTGANEVAVLHAETGKLLNTFIVGAAAPDAPRPEFLHAAPQYDAETGQLLVFAGNTLHTVEPNTGKVLGAKAFDVSLQGGCGTTNGPLPVNRTFFDAESRLLYLEFQTYTCTPYVGYTVVAYDMAQGQELSRQGTLPYTGLAAGGGFYAMSWYRMGVGTVWTERNGKPATSRGGWSGGGPFQLDPKRLQLYQSADSAIRIFDAFDLSLRAVVPQPLKGTLAAYDPRTDQVYFVDGGTIRPFAAARLRAAAPAPVTVKVLPRQPVLAVAPSPNWAKDKTVFALWSQPPNATTCYVFNQAGGALLRSTDRGKSWTGGAVGLGKDCAVITSLAVSPNYARDRTLFAGIKGNGIFKSIDGGLSWVPSGTNLANMSVTGLALNPGFATESTLFASIADTGLQRSANRGATWQTLKTAANPVFALSPEFDRDGAVAVLGMKPDGTPLLQLSEDRGDHWRIVPATLPAITPRLLSLAPAFARWHVMFIGDFNGDLYRSADGGISWQRVLQTGKAQVPGTGADRVQIAYGPNEERREVFLVISGIRYEGEKRVPWGNLYRSQDGGQSWAESDAGKGNIPTALAISPSYAQDGLLFIGTMDGRVLSLKP